MGVKTIVIRKYNKMYGGYEYVEFSTGDQMYSTGNSSAHLGHGDTMLRIEVSSKRELQKHIDSLMMLGFKEVETFYGLYV